MSSLEELRSDLDEPLRLDREHIVAILARGEDDLVIDAPLGRAPEERARRMDVHRRVLGERPVAPPPRIAQRGVPEKPRADRAPHAVAVAGPRPRADNVVLVPKHDPEKLRAHVPRAAHVLCVYKVPRAPRVAEAARFPGVVGGEERQVVALWLVEGRFLRVGLRLFVPRAVEDAWD